MSRQGRERRSSTDDTAGAAGIGATAGRRTRATKAAVNAVVVGALLITLSASTRDGWLVLLAGLAFGLVAAALLLRPHVDRMGTTVTLPHRCRAGDEVPATIVTTNHGRRTLPATTFVLGGPGIADVDVRVPPLAPGRTAVAELVLVAAQRGVVNAVTVTTSTAAPLSLLAVSCARTVPVQLVVQPRLDAPLSLGPSGRGGEATVVSAAPGVDVQGVREWHRGEATGRLYARGTARRGVPLVLDRYDDAGHGIAVVVADGSEHPLWEPMLSVVASTLVEAARAGRPVALVAEQRGLDDTRGPDADGLLDACARLGHPQRSTAATVRRAAAAVGDGGTVVLVDLRAGSTTEAAVDDVAAAAAEGTDLLVLHPLGVRTDALCLHDARRGCPGGAA